MMHRARACSRNCDFVDLHWRVRHVISVSRHARYLLHQFHARRIALPKDRVLAIQARIRNLSDEELRGVRVRSSIRVGHASWTIKRQVGRSLIFKRVARPSWAALSIAQRIAALDHE